MIAKLNIYFFSLAFFGLAHVGAETRYISTLGNIYPSSKSIIGCQVTGKVKAMWVDIGDEVKKGQTVVQIDPQFIRIDAEVKGAALKVVQLEMADAELNYQRMSRLWEKTGGEAPSISLKKFEEAKSRYEISAARVKEMEQYFNRERANLEETDIKAPFDAVVTKKFVDVGESVTSIPATQLLEIQALSPVYLEFSVPQSYLSLLQVGTPIEFEMEGNTRGRQSAQINLIYPSLDEATRSVRCRAVIENGDQTIRPGSLVKVTIKGSAQ